MSKKAKSEAQERRKKEKAKRKAANKARYEGYIAAGTNRKTKRGTIKSRKASSKLATHDHPNGACGNVGCRKCGDGPNFEAFMVKDLDRMVPHRMPQWMYLMWKARQTS